MHVIRLPNGNLRVPHSAVSTDPDVFGQMYVEIGPDDPDYARLWPQSLTEAEAADRRRRWSDDDEALGRLFDEWKAQPGG